MTASLAGERTRCDMKDDIWFKITAVGGNASVSHTVERNNLVSRKINL